MIVGDKVVFEKNLHDSTKWNLLLDLDSTIVHSKKYAKNNKSLLYNEDDYFSIICEYETPSHVYKIHVRNNTFDFLNEMFGNFNIYIYTMGCFDYASCICKSIEHLIGKEIFSGIVARDGKSTKQFKYFYVLKHLTIDNTIIIDDNIDVWIKENQQNLIKINKFVYNNYSDYLNDVDIEKLKNIIIQNKNMISKIGIHNVVKLISDTYMLKKQ